MLPSLWSNADFRRANIDTLRRGLHNPLPRGGVAAEQVVSALAVDVIDGLHSTASGRFFAWVIGGALSAALDADWLTAAWDQNAYNYVTGPAAALVEECEPQTACGH
jgi:aromatic-L-amino-acid decarboxylase